MSNEIQIVPVLPPGPFVLADEKFVAVLSECESQISALKITDALSNQNAADLQIKITRAGLDLEATRKKLVRPALDWQDLVNGTAKPVAARIDRAKVLLSAELTRFRLEQERIAAEAERARQAELARLERIRLAEEAEARRKADEIARQAAEAETARLAKLSADARALEAELAFEEPPIAEEDLPPIEKTETELKIEAVRFAVAPVVAAPSGVSFREELRIKSADPMKLPEAFIERTAKLATLRACFCAPWSVGKPLPECAGVVFEVHRAMVSTGRRA